MAVFEHLSHVSDVFGVKVSYAYDVLQIEAIFEPRAGAGGAVPGKGIVEHNVLDFFRGVRTITCPSRMVSMFGHIKDETIISMGGALIVIIKSERSVVRC